MKRDKGFTLFELIIACIIISLLAGLSFVFYTKTTEKAKSAEAVTVMGAIKDAEVMHKLVQGTYIGAENTDEINALLGMDIVPRYYEYKIVGAEENNFTVIAERIAKDVEAGMVPAGSIVIAMDQSGALTPGYPGAGGGGTGGAGGIGGGGGFGGGGGGTGGGGGGTGGGGIGDSGGGTSGGGTSGGGGGTGGGGGGTGGGGETTSPGTVAADLTATELTKVLDLLKDTTNGDYFYDLIEEKEVSVVYADLGTDVGGLTIPTWWLDVTECPDVYPNCKVNTIYLNSKLREISWTAEAIATVLVHEAMHSDYDHNTETHVTETTDRLGVDRSELSWSLDAVRGEYILGDSQDQEYMAFRQMVLFWREVKGSQTNTSLDDLLSKYEQDEEGGTFLKEEVISRYSDYPPYYKS